MIESVAVAVLLALFLVAGALCCGVWLGRRRVTALGADSARTMSPPIEEEGGREA